MRILGLAGAALERARERASFKTAISDPLTEAETEKMRHFGSLVCERVAAIREDCAQALRESKPV